MTVTFLFHFLRICIYKILFFSYTLMTTFFYVLSVDFLNSKVTFKSM